MTATGHAVIGVVIASGVSNPVIGIPLAIVSHLAADAFPHWDVATNVKKKSRERLFLDSAIDVFLSFFLSYLLIHFFFPKIDLLYAFAMVFAAQLLDWTTMPYYFFGIKLPPFTWSYRLQKKFDNSLDKPWGIIWQVAVLMFLVYYATLI